jgi:hypothetical protein
MVVGALTDAEATQLTHSALGVVGDEGETVAPGLVQYVLDHAQGSPRDIVMLVDVLLRENLVAVCAKVGPAGICRHYFRRNRQIENSRHMPGTVGIFEGFWVCHGNFGRTCGLFWAFSAFYLRVFGYLDGVTGPNWAYSAHDRLNLGNEA